MTGLTHPRDLAAWQRWQDRQHPLRALRARLRPGPPVSGVLTSGSDPTVLLVLDSASPTSLAAVLSAARHLPADQVAVLAPYDASALLPVGDRTVSPWVGLPASVGAVVSAGHHLALGATAYDEARRRGIPSVVVQHGLLTPSAPPLPEGSRLLAWSEADAAYWTAGREDVAVTVVGSQLLWEAGAHSAPAGPALPPTYLGQLHGAELRRRDLARAAEAFCLAEDATYRPHPSERDRRSRWQHRRWERQGILVDRAGGPLRELGTPVVSVFSTGVLEAAARGMSAWVDLPDPPAWLEEFWARYDLGRWGGPPTSAPARDERAPAARVADAIGELS